MQQPMCPMLMWWTIERGSLVKWYIWILNMKNFAIFFTKPFVNLIDGACFANIMIEFLLHSFENFATKLKPLDLDFCIMHSTNIFGGFSSYTYHLHPILGSNIKWREEKCAFYAFCMYESRQNLLNKWDVLLCSFSICLIVYSFQN